MRSGVGNFTSNDEPFRSQGSVGMVTAKSASLVAIQSLRGAAPLGMSFVLGRATIETDVIATCSGAFSCTNSPLPSPPRFSAQVVSRSPSVSAAGTPMPLDADTPCRIRPTPSGAGAALASAVIARARSRSLFQRRWILADLKARSFGSSTLGESSEDRPQMVTSSRTSPTRTRTVPSGSGSVTSRVSPCRSPISPFAYPSAPDQRTRASVADVAAKSAPNLRPCTQSACRPAPMANASATKPSEAAMSGSGTLESEGPAEHGVCAQAR